MPRPILSWEWFSDLAELIWRWLSKSANPPNLIPRQIFWLYSVYVHGTTIVMKRNTQTCLHVHHVPAIATKIMHSKLLLWHPIVFVPRYEYQLTREYNWNVKNKASKGYEVSFAYLVYSSLTLSDSACCLVGTCMNKIPFVHNNNAHIAVPSFPGFPLGTSCKNAAECVGELCCYNYVPCPRH